MFLIGLGQTTDEAGALAAVVLSVVLYGLMALREWWSDVRYYRARKVVRKREG